MTEQRELSSHLRRVIGRRSATTDPELGLVSVTATQWKALPEDERQEALTELDARFHQLLAEVYDSANRCVGQFNRLSVQHLRWRRTLIIGTGLLAVINLVAAAKIWPERGASVPPIIAAVFAVVLAVLANLESFQNCLEKAQGYRDSRELFLDAAREFDRLWDALVRPLSDQPEACVNAAEIYKRLVGRDRELRAKFSELTKVEGKAATKAK